MNNYPIRLLEELAQRKEYLKDRNPISDDDIINLRLEMATDSSGLPRELRQKEPNYNNIVDKTDVVFYKFLREKIKNIPYKINKSPNP